LTVTTEAGKEFSTVFGGKDVSLVLKPGVVTGIAMVSQESIHIVVLIGKVRGYLECALEKGLPTAVNVRRLILSE